MVNFIEKWWYISWWRLQAQREVDVFENICIYPIIFPFEIVIMRVVMGPFINVWKLIDFMPLGYFISRNSMVQWSLHIVVLCLGCHEPFYKCLKIKWFYAPWVFHFTKLNGSLHMVVLCLTLYFWQQLCTSSGHVCE